MPVDDRLHEMVRLVDARPVDTEAAYRKVEAMGAQQTARRRGAVALVAAAAVAATVWGATSLDVFSRSAEPTPVDQPVPTAVTTPDTQPEVVGDLTGTSWVLDSFALGGDLRTAAAESTLVFAEGGVAGGSTGCNRFRVAWQQDGAALTLDVDTPQATAIACPDQAVTDQEQAVLDLLPRVATAEVSEGALVLVDVGGSPVLTYTEAITNLAGTAWTASGLYDLTGDAVGGLESSALISTVSAEFADDGSVSGFTGCRPYTGIWASDPSGRTLAVNDVTTQGEACTGAAGTIETRYLRELESVGGFFVEGSTLDLKRGPAIDDDTLVRYALDTS